jgi:HEAT repeat protein
MIPRVLIGLTLSTGLALALVSCGGDLGDRAALSALDSSDDELRLRAIETLVRRGTEVVPAVEELLARGSSRQRQAAVGILARISKDPATTETLAELLSDADQGVQLRAALQLASPPRRDPRARAALEARIADPDLRVRLQVTRLLAEVGDAATVARLEARLPVEGNPEVQRSLERSLARLRDRTGQ